jgi:hypothetical protein
MHDCQRWFQFGILLRVAAHEKRNSMKTKINVKLNNALQYKETENKIHPTTARKTLVRQPQVRNFFRSSKRDKLSIQFLLNISC